MLGTQVALLVTETSINILPPLRLFMPAGGGERGLVQPGGAQGFPAVGHVSCTCTPAEFSWLTLPSSCSTKTPRVKAEKLLSLVYAIHLCAPTHIRAQGMNEWASFPGKETEAQRAESCDLPQITQLEMEWGGATF